MDTKLEIFSNDQFGSVRTMTDNGKVWFCGIDVAAALGYKDTTNALKLHCKEDGVVFYHLIDSIGRQQKAKFLSEGNVYRLIAHSKLPAAERFEVWVFEEVLPTIRKHGAYMTDSVLDQVLSHPDTIYSLAETLLKERNERVKLQQRLAAEQPKIDYVDNCVDPMGSTNIRNTAKELGIPQNLFVSQLLKYQFLYRDRTGKLLPFADKAKKGYFTVKDAHTQYGQSVPQTFVTVLGKQYLIQYFKTKGVF